MARREGGACHTLGVCRRRVAREDDELLLRRHGLDDRRARRELVIGRGTHAVQRIRAFRRIRSDRIELRIALDVPIARVDDGVAMLVDPVGEHRQAADDARRSGVRWVDEVVHVEPAALGGRDHEVMLYVDDPPDTGAGDGRLFGAIWHDVRRVVAGSNKSS